MVVCALITLGPAFIGKERDNKARGRNENQKRTSEEITKTV